MRKVTKNQQTIIRAYRLGDSSAEEESMISAGKIYRLQDGSYELFSRESAHGAGEHVEAGDYFKIDNAGYPYPNSCPFFEMNHMHLSGDEYIQKPKALDAWLAGDAICPEIQFLIKEKGLVLRLEHPEVYFNAPLWGSQLSAARDAVLIFYSITRDEQGDIVDADFNFVAREEFNQTYRFIETDASLHRSNECTD